MQASITDSGPCKKTLAIEVEPERVKSSYDEALSELCREAQIKGFRRGRAPRERVERQFGEAIIDDLKQKLVGEVVGEAVKEHELKVINLGAPLDPESLDIKIGEAFNFSVELEVFPEIELPDYNELVVEVPKTELTDDEVQAGIENLRRQSADIKPVEGAKVEHGDQLIVDFKLIADEETLAEQTEAALELSHAVVVGLPLSVEPEKLVGMASEEERTIEDLEIDNFSPLRDHRGKKAKLTVKAHEIRRPELMDLNDDFAKKLGMESMDELRERVRTSLAAQRESEARKVREDAVMDKLVDLTTFELPEGILDQMSNQYAAQSANFLARLGMEQDDILGRSSQITESSRARGEGELRRSFIVQAVAEAEAIELSDEELEKGLADMAGPRGNPLEVRETLEKQGRLAGVRGELLERKVVDFLIGRADIRESEAKEAPPKEAKGKKKAKKKAKKPSKKSKKKASKKSRGAEEKSE